MFCFVLFCLLRCFFSFPPSRTGSLTQIESLLVQTQLQCAHKYSYWLVKSRQTVQTENQRRRWWLFFVCVFRVKSLVDGIGGPFKIQMRKSKQAVWRQRRWRQWRRSSSPGWLLTAVYCSLGVLTAAARLRPAGGNDDDVDDDDDNGGDDDDDEAKTSFNVDVFVLLLIFQQILSSCQNLPVEINLDDSSALCKEWTSSLYFCSKHR